MDEYQCDACKYTYSPSNGDRKRSIPPNTPFESLPHDWTCPECGAQRQRFGKKSLAKPEKNVKSSADDLRYISSENAAWKGLLNR